MKFREIKTKNVEPPHRQFAAANDHAHIQIKSTVGVDTLTTYNYYYFVKFLSTRQKLRFSNAVFSFPGITN